MLPLTAILESLAARPNLVLVAPPGTGKTTLVPPALLDAPWLAGGRVVVLEPRRLAARAAATRMAALAGEPVGRRFGFRTRTDRAVSAETRVEVVTEGLLVARLLGDPTLEGVGCVVLDEVHERNLDGDLALALCLDLQRSRPELRLLAMSATADAAVLAAAMRDGAGDAPVIEAAGTAHPVAIRNAARDLPAPTRGAALAEAVARACRAALAEPGEGDVLAFLPGKGEIARAARALAGCGAEVLPLHGDLPPDAQAALLAPRAATGVATPAARRVILATSIAETSLTVPGVRIVVDGGFRRTPRLDPGRGLARLETVRISRAAARQRAGRAGREAPGTAIRLWTGATERGMPPFDRPEIREAELAPLVLALAAWEHAWGTAPASLRFPDPPPAAASEAARALLADLGALDADGRATPAGRAMARLGTHPRLAAMMLSAESAPEAALACDLAALLEERDPLAGPGREAPSADVALRLAALARHRGGHGGDGATARVLEAARAHRRRLALPDRLDPAGDPAALLARAFPDRVGLSRGEGAFRLAGGGSAALAAHDPLARARLLVAAGLHLGRSARITLAAVLDPAALPRSLRDRCTEAEERGVDPATGRVLARRRLRLGALVLEDRLLEIEPGEAAGALAAAAAGRLDALLDWTGEARALQARAALGARIGLALADLSDAALARDADAFLAGGIARAGIARLADLARLDVAALLAARLGTAGRAALDRALPETLPLAPGAARARLDYGRDPPVASARAQSFYGLDRLPEIAGGRVRPAAELLSPAGRPIAITADLAAFWRGGWAEVLRDMRGRYPRHHWPEHPGRARAGAP